VGGKGKSRGSRVCIGAKSEPLWSHTSGKEKFGGKGKFSDWVYEKPLSVNKIWFEKGLGGGELGVVPADFSLRTSKMERGRRKRLSFEATEGGIKRRKKFW